MTKNRLCESIPDREGEAIPTMPLNYPAPHIYNKRLAVLSFWKSQGVTEESGGRGEIGYKAAPASGGNVLIPNPGC